MDAAASRRTTSITTGFDSSRTLRRLRQDLYFPSGALAPLHPLQFAGALPGIEAALCGALVVGAIVA